MCQHESRKRHGRDRNGFQRFRCLDCGKTWVEEQRPLGAKRLPMDTACSILHHLLEGTSIRATSRLTGAAVTTILDLLEFAGERCESFLDATLVDVCVDEMEVDEVWAFVGMKEKTRERLERAQVYGDSYTFVGIERNTKLVVAYHLGKRTPQDASAFAYKLRRATAGRFQLSTDGFTPYRVVMPMTFGSRIDYCQIIKTYGTPPEAEQRKYSPPTVIDVTYEYITGKPDMERVCTSIVERSNLSLRMSARRFTRLTNGYSKKWANHGYMLALWFAYYNFCRKHHTIKTTPAVATGLTDHVWTIRELLENAAKVD